MNSTQKDLAERAGVTLKTISRYFNNRNLVAQKTREKIESACEEMAYMPNYAARTIRSNKFYRVACVYMRKIHDDPSDPSHQHMFQYINGMAETLSTTGYSLELAPITIYNSRPEESPRFPKIFSENSVDGLIFLTPGDVPKAIYEQLLKNRKIGVWLNNDEAPENWEQLLVNEYEGAYKMTELLIQQGCRQVVWLDSSPSKQLYTHYSVYQRRSGYKAALRDAGLPDSLEVKIDRNLSKQTLKTVFGKYPKTDAILANCDPLRLLLDDEISKQMKNGLKIARFSSEWQNPKFRFPEFTTDITPEYQMGANAAHYLLAKFEGRPADEFLKPVMPRIWHNGKYLKLL